MPASHHSLSLTPLRALACLALLSVVAAGIAITVILSQSTNPMFSIRREVIVPDLSGAAQLSIVWDTRYSAQAEGIVIAQKPTAGSTVKQGQKLILSVSKGPNTITVPDLKSQNRSDAIQTLRDAGFTVSVDYIRNDPTLQADTVILQSPAAGTALEAGDCITLTVARAVPDPFRQVPSLLGMSVAEARRRLAIVELLPTLTPSNLTEGTITAQDPLPGTLLHRNAHVRLVAK
jgi:beta-lactam-binding protein with PASTA domain